MREFTAQPSGFERKQVGGSQGSGPRGTGSVTGGGSKPANFGPAHGGKFQRSGKSFDGDVRDLPFEAPRPKERPEREDPVINPGVVPPAAGGDTYTSSQADSGASLSADSLLAAAAPAPMITYDGLDFANWGAGHPPDTNGDVGPTYYIQTVNTSIGIYNKKTGVRVAAFTFDTFMSQGHFGNLCDTDNFGDPVVVYDSFEDRWIITDFAFKLDASGNVSPQTAYECIAASKTGDPVAGGWNYYSILAPGGLADYPKFGIWPDGLYMAANMFPYAASGSYMGYHVWAINKTQMYAGAPTVQYVDFAGSTSDFTVIPANARLQTGTPPAGSSEYFLSTEQFLNGLSIYKLHVDWNKVSTSTFTGPFTQLAPNCWPNATPANASTPANAADVLATRAMVQAQYTNIGGAESIWLGHTVQRGVSTSNSTCNATTGGNATIRWYQANVTGGNVAGNVSQGQSFDPEGANTFFRFMPSVAADRMGNMAIGYTKSNATTNPQMKYAGRLAGDPVNTITQSEQTLIDGTGTQSGNCGGSPCTRWGDYAAMTLDPDGCTFWYTSEYYATNGLNDLTRIGSFSYPSCTTISNGTITGSVTASAGGTPISGATVELGSRSTTTDANGNYSFTVPSGTYPVETATFPGMTSAAVNSIVVPNGGVVVQNFTLGSAPASSCLQDTTQGDFQAGILNNTDLTTGAGNVILAGPVGINQQNTTVSTSGLSFNNTTWIAQTFTPSANGQITSVALDLFCSSCSGTAPNLVMSIRNVSGGVPTGADLVSATVPFSLSPSSSYFSASFTTPLAVTAGTQYAIVLRTATAFSTGSPVYIKSPATDPYPNGFSTFSNSSGSTWSTGGLTSIDLGFKVFMSTGFSTSGDLISAVRDANPAPGQTAVWGTLSWNSTVPANTSLKFQVAASDSFYGPYGYVGPDGTAATFFTASGGSLAQFNGKRYLRYRAFLTTTDTSVTPTLNDVTMCFTNTATSTPTPTPTPLPTPSPTPSVSPTPTPSTGRTDVALATNGSVATASSTYGSGYLPATAINGDRKGLNAGSDGFWNDGTPDTYPDWLEVDFAGTKTVDEIDVFTVQDSYQSPSDPTPTMTFSNYGITAFDVQYWNGSAWATVPGGSITNNNKVWTKVSFTAVYTPKIRVVVNNALATFSRITEVEAWEGGGGSPAPSPTPTPSTGRTDVALSSNGGVATASSSYATQYSPAGTIDGDRAGLNWGSGGGWNDGTANIYPDWLEVAFAGTKTVDEIDVFTIQDSYQSPSDPTPTMTFSNYGITAFDVQYWNGSSWVTVPGGSITGNNKVWTKVSFTAVYTPKIRVLVNNALASFSRITEVEAWEGGEGAPTPTPTPTPSGVRTDVALATNGGVATASSTYGSGYLPATAINGDRKGLNAGSDGFWNDGTPDSYPDWLEVDFAGTKTVDEIDVFTIQDSYQSPSDPTDTMTFTSYGITAFDVQYWNGSAWATVPGGSITNNNKVWTKVSFTAVYTPKIRVVVNNALATFGRITEVEAWEGGGGSPAPSPTPTPSTGPMNVALAANGGVATASSTYSSGYSPVTAINGDRKGINAGNGGFWNDATGDNYPDWLEVDFAGTKTINEIDVFTVQDNFTSPSEPTDTMVFSNYGITAFDVQYWTGSAWATVPGGSITGKNKVWTKIDFSAIATTKIRVVVSSALSSFSRITEVEAWTG